MSANPKARILAEALPYIRAYHGKTLVIRFGGHAMADDVLKAGFARDVALLRLVGMKPIVVHGGGWRIDELLRRTGKESRRHRGVRITDEGTLTIIEMALGELNQELVGLINRHGGRAVGLNGQDGRFSRLVQPRLSPTWIVPTRHPEALRKALETMPGQDSQVSRLPSLPAGRGRDALQRCGRGALARLT